MIPNPKGDRIVVRPDDVKTETDGGILLADEAQERPSQGEIVKLGPDVTDLSIGETAIYGRYSGDDVTVDGVLYKILKEKEVYATL